MAGPQEPGFPHYDFDGSRFDDEWESAQTDAVAADNGAGEKDAATRMGIKLLEYNQVIALSQACINAMLARHYDYINKDLKRINVVLDSGGRESIRNGVIKAPWIELIETSRAPQYLFFMEFVQGTFTYYDIEEGKATKVEKSMRGWIIAFHVNLVETPLASLPSRIASNLSRPEAHTGTKLALLFGKDTQRLQFDKCRILGYTDPKRRNAAQHQLTTFVGAWVDQMKAARPEDAEPVLLYTATINPNHGDKAEASRANRPFATATSVNVQIISHRPDGVNDKGITTANRYNAFVYAQMTESRTLPRDDLRWTGNWFYGPFGGTVLVNRAAFWDPLILKFTGELRDTADAILKDQIWRARGDSWSGNTKKPDTAQTGWTESRDGLDANWHTKFDVQSSHTTEGSRHGGAYRDDFYYTSSLLTTIRPCTGQGRLKATIAARTNAMLTSTLFPNFAYELGKYGASLRLQGDFETIVDFYINLDSFNDSAGLRLTAAADVQNSQINTQTKWTTAAPSEDRLVRTYEELILKKQDFHNWKGGHEAFVKERLPLTAISLQNRLNEAKEVKFPNIIPGSRQKFTLKDPIFTNSGDLMVGLSLSYGDA